MSERGRRSTWSTGGPDPEGLHDTRDVWLGVGLMVLAYVAAVAVVMLRPSTRIGDAAFTGYPIAIAVGAAAGIVALVTRRWAALMGLAGGFGLVTVTCFAAGFLLPHAPPPDWNGAPYFGYPSISK